MEVPRSRPQSGFFGRRSQDIAVGECASRGLTHGREEANWGGFGSVIIKKVNLGNDLNTNLTIILEKEKELGIYA